MTALDEALGQRRADRYNPLVRIAACWPDGSIREMWDLQDRIVLGGRVREDRSRQVRRSCTPELLNERGLLSPTAPGDLWFNGSRFRVWWGVRIASADIYDLYFDGIVSRFTAEGAMLRITGDDLTSLLDQSFGEVVEVEAGMTASQAVARICGTILEPYVGPASTWDLDDGGRTVGYRAWTEADNRLSSVVDLMANLGLDFWAGREGPPVLRSTPDPTTAEVARVIDQDPFTGDILTLSRTGSGRPFNVSIAVSQLEDGTVLRGESRVTDPLSPIHEDRIGRQVAVHRNNQMPDLASCFAVARQRLIQNAFVDQVSLDAIPDPTTREDDVAQVHHRMTATDARHRIDVADHPIVSGPMRVAATRISPLFEAL